MSKIRCVRCPENGLAEVVEIENDLASLQKEVGGYIETLPLVDDITIVCNEEGKINGLKPNRGVTWHYRDVEIINGDFLIVKTKDEEFDSMDRSEAMKWAYKFYYEHSISEVAI